METAAVTPQPRDYHKEMFACMMAAFSRKGHSVTVTANATQFRCKPAANGGVILYKGTGRKQYSYFATWEEWIAWAQDVEGAL